MNLISSSSFSSLSSRWISNQLSRLRRNTISLSILLLIIIITYLHFYPTKFSIKYTPHLFSSSLLDFKQTTRSSHSNSRWSPTLTPLEPTFRTAQDGLKYPPNVYPASMNPYRRSNATFVSLVRNSELDTIMQSIRSVEDRINRKFGYPWVFLNDQPFTEAFKSGVRSMTRSQVHFGLIPSHEWAYPPFIDQERANRTRVQMGQAGIVYGDSESYRLMCRYQSGFFFRHPIMLNFDYYWRVEPGIEYYCDLDYDPFVFMEANRKIYSFTLSLYDYQATLPTLWNATRSFVEANPDSLAPDNSLGFIVNEIEKGLEADYNLCHFWSNFEIGDMRFWRSKTYLNFFHHLDQQGGFFYERWGDAPVHSIAASLFLSTSQIHQWNDLGYYHSPFVHCPTNVPQYHANGQCFCDPADNFDLQPYSCTPRWWKISGVNPNA